MTWLESQQCICDTCPQREHHDSNVLVTEYSLCGQPDEENCCVCVRPLGHPLDESKKEYHQGIGFLYAPLPSDIHPSFMTDVKGRRALTTINMIREKLQMLNHEGQLTSEGRDELYAILEDAGLKAKIDKD